MIDGAASQVSETAATVLALGTAIAAGAGRRPPTAPLATLRVGSLARLVFEDWYTLRVMTLRQVRHADQP
jgi:hypothetical protein